MKLPCFCDLRHPNKRISLYSPTPITHNKQIPTQTILSSKKISNRSRLKRRERFNNTQQVHLPHYPTTLMPFL
jgi:hypothetical protein